VVDEIDSPVGVFGAGNAAVRRYVEEKFESNHK
jgi:hypothetical protein